MTEAELKQITDRLDLINKSLEALLKLTEENNKKMISSLTTVGNHIANAIREQRSR